MKYIPANKRQCEQHGLGMVEVMVTLFILSIGLLGVAYLQFVGSYTNSEALSRSQSVLVAQQLVNAYGSVLFFRLSEMV